MHKMLWGDLPRASDNLAVHPRTFLRNSLEVKSIGTLHT